MTERFSGPVRALIIDDEEITLDLLERLIAHMGAAEVMTALDGATGLRLACESVPTFIVCDVAMTPVDGLSFLGGLRNSMDRRIASIPVIMFTADPSNDTEVKASRLGVDGYYKKPFNPKGLAERFFAIANRRLEQLAVMESESSRAGRS